MRAEGRTPCVVARDPSSQALGALGVGLGELQARELNALRALARPREHSFVLRLGGPFPPFTLLHYIYPNPRLSFHFFILFWLLCAFYYCKSLLPTIGRLDPRVPPDSVLLHSTVKLAPFSAFLRRRHRVGRFFQFPPWRVFGPGCYFEEVAFRGFPTGIQRSIGWL